MVCNADSVVVPSRKCHVQPDLDNQESEEFSAEKFVERLLNEGSDVLCDDTSAAFNLQGVPPYYDEEKYKRGQQFFYKHMFGLLLGKFLGLISILSQKSSLSILILTNMSSSEYSVYRRYMSTIFHMCIWYEETLKPGSRTWQSLNEIRSKHNSASKKAKCRLNYGINQKDMALTQFGFMGYALVRSEAIGVYKATDEELGAMAHIWRVIGYALGIEERFNICRESLEETKQICNVIIDRVLNPAIQKREREFVEMSTYLINGLWPMNPALNVNVFTYYLHMVTRNEYRHHQVDKEDPLYLRMNKPERNLLFGIITVLNNLEYDFIRWCYSRLQMFGLWLMRNFPFLAYYMYGRKRSHIKILTNNGH